MVSENLPYETSKQQPLNSYIREAAQKLGLPTNHEAVLQHAAILYENSKLNEKNAELQAALQAAEIDPLTGYWNKGPGFRKLEDLISLVENKQAGLIDDETTPNAIFGLGIDLEGLHYTNNWYGQEGGDARLVELSREISGVADILKGTVRKDERRKHARQGSTTRPQDILIRTGGDEFMAAYGVTLSPEHDETEIANILIDRFKVNKDANIPGARVLIMGGFWQPGQSPEDFYYSVEPKAHMPRAQKLARPVIKFARLGLGQYKPTQPEISEL